MSIVGDALRGARSIITGGLPDLAKGIVTTIQGQFPEKMSEAESRQMDMAVQNQVQQFQIQFLEKWNEESKNWEDFVRDMEGTASDLKSLPIVGRIMLFLRGSQRPVCGFGTMWCNYRILSGAWDLTEMAGENAHIAWTLLLIMDILVFGFIFGERAIQNIMPIVIKLADVIMSRIIPPGGKGDK